MTTVVKKKLAIEISKYQREKAFIWVSGLCFIDKKLLMAIIFFRFFTENNPARGTGKNIYSRHELVKETGGQCISNGLLMIVGASACEYGVVYVGRTSTNRITNAVDFP